MLRNLRKYLTASGYLSFGGLFYFTLIHDLLGWEFIHIMMGILFLTFIVITFTIGWIADKERRKRGLSWIDAASSYVGGARFGFFDLKFNKNQDFKFSFIWVLVSILIFFPYVIYLSQFGWSAFFFVFLLGYIFIVIGLGIFFRVWV